MSGDSGGKSPQSGGAGGGRGPKGGGGGGGKGAGGKAGGGAPGRGDGPAAGTGRGAQSDDGRKSGAQRGGPLGDHAEVGAFDAIRHTLANFVDVHGRNAIVDGSHGDVNLGDHHHHYGAQDGAPRLVSGAVHRDELRRLRLVFEEPPDHAELLELLKQQRLIALCGDPGSGRKYAALSLLDAVTHGRVERMDPRTELDRITESDLEAEHGYHVAISGDELFAPAHRPKHDRREEERRRHTERPAELHLDRLSDLLKRRGAYAVLVIDAGSFADELLRGRYGRLFRPPSADGMLRKHLVSLLGHADEEGLEQALALSRRQDVVDATGLDRLRPHEVETLARLLVAHLSGETSEGELLAALRSFSRQQARMWFAATGRTDPRNRDAVAAATRQSAFRTALAVYNGAPYSVAAEAAEQLSWELALTLDPEHQPGRAVFHDHRQSRLAAARAEIVTGTVTYDDRRLETRSVRLQGRALSWAVLSHVWDEYHNARGPMCRWLRTLCDDSRPMVWIPAAITAGTLCTLDYPYVRHNVLFPMASADSFSQRMAAATALAQAAALDDSVRRVVREEVRTWARYDDDVARLSTAALVHGYGTVEPSVSASLDELGLLVGREDWDLLDNASHSVARLAAGTEPGTVLRRLGAWLGDRRQNRRDLALCTVDRLVWQRPSRLWGLGNVPELESHLNWPLIAALLAARINDARMVADLVWCGLDTARWRAELEASLAEWMRRADDNAELLDTLCHFLPRLVSSAGDAERLLNVVRRMERDPDEALTQATVRRLRAAIPGQPPGDVTVIRQPDPSGRSAEKAE
ncbi:hypothetical protein [Streptomyces sp. NBC_01618]|uniref:hypothetical protein n=1 Tax=Streptomyces sp. NBC_01618 TaxID=2975900 RepID=UPI00386A4EDA|nr:hypothetical protein OH735_31580 [Streptomyces sp. NBC_01618]